MYSDAHTVDSSVLSGNDKIERVSGDVSRLCDIMLHHVKGLVPKIFAKFDRLNPQKGGGRQMHRGGL